ncbi:molybdenum cofactor sulfurase [Anopheles funestus]|uniref:Molybdenum cofactor sulfurase n=1 Tax=Anopheles funestus TaxID=62324 RepID=A0A182RBH2_ANOFN|nr:molybdenum cofactor sulfurase [Anopheles funestus]XP_049291682.1 molybdenum cofactor sulfurase [Anopheles funestus]XP_049291691.1 molybdenum cofactor sulfurase [Anopheles funestus]
MMDFINEYTEEERLKIEQDFLRLNDKCYLDHAGTALYGASQLRAVHELLASGLYCNPHTSRTMEDLIDLVRYRILRWFNTRPTEYGLVFTSGTTASLKLLGESFGFGEPDKVGSFVYLRDSHTSVLGMREIVRTERIRPIERTELLQVLNEPKGVHQRLRPSLLVFPAQCNFNGVKYPLELIELVERNGLRGYGEDEFHVCLDAASYVSTSPLDLTRFRPSFVCVSFYKIFGYPTGLGALLVRKDAEHLLLAGRRYYGGGTVKIAMSGQNAFHEKRDTLAERFEDGTINFLSITALLPCMDALERLIPGATMERIQRHTFQLARYCFRELQALQHANGGRVVELYHDTAFGDPASQGAIVNFNVLNDDGSHVGFAEVACMAANHGIYLRTGCFCNPGACQRHLRLADDDLLRHYRAGHVCGDANDLIDGQPTGSVRVSFGYCTRPADIDRLVAMIRRCYVRRSLTGPLAGCSLSRDQILAQYKSYDRPRLVQICLYPVKSCGPHRVTDGNWPLAATGLRYDRTFLIVDEHGVAMTQKKLPEMCRIRPTVEQNRMTLRHDELEDELAIELDEPAETDAVHSAVQLCQTKVCRDSVQGVDCGDDCADWVSRALGVSGLRLLRQSAHDARLQRRTTRELSLNNQAQLLLINRTSVRWLRDKVDDWDGAEMPSLDSLVDRFRGNLIIETARPLEESDWHRVRIGQSGFSVDGPCTRCQMICIDQTSGERTAEPLRTISREFGGRMRFGVYLSREDNDQDGTPAENGTAALERELSCGATVSGVIDNVNE